MNPTTQLLTDEEVEYILSCLAFAKDQSMNDLQLQIQVAEKLHAEFTQHAYLLKRELV